MPFESCFLHLVDRLSLFSPPSTGLVLALKKVLSLVSLEKGRVLVDIGKRQQLVWFMISGTAKEVTPAQGFAKGKATWFWFEDDFVFSYPGFFAQEPAISSIELVEDSRMLQLSYPDFMLLKERFSEMHLLVEKVRGHYDRVRVQHTLDMASLSAKERYQKFYAAHKRVFNVARHKDIAAFLGIKDDGFHRYQ